MRPAARCYLCRKRVLRQFCVLERSKRCHLVHICPPPVCATFYLRNQPNSGAPFPLSQVPLCNSSFPHPRG